jgi:hypothetical protein
MMDQLNANHVTINATHAPLVLINAIHAYQQGQVIEKIPLLFVLVVMDFLIMGFWHAFNAIHLYV